jgi:Pvc16 N-terminal domain
VDQSEVVLDVSNTLVAAINGAVADLFAPNTTIAAVNDLSEPTTTTSPLPPITVFLYEIMEDPASRNLPLVQQTQNKTVVVSLPPMALQLNYLITPWTLNFDTDQRLLGRVLRLFYENAIMSGPQLQGVLASSADSLKITLHQISLEDRTRIWFALERPYRTSLSYGVRVVWINPTQSQTRTRVSTSRLASSFQNGATT